MHPSSLVPVPDAIPVAWPWFQILLTATFVVHVLFMNAMFGGAAIVLVGAATGRGPGLAAAKHASAKVPLLVAFAVNAGVAPLLFLQVLYGHLVYTSSILMAGWWLSIIGILILAYYGAYLLSRRFDALGGARVVVAAFVALLLLVISFFFSNNMTLALTPDRWTAYFAHPDGSFLNLGEPTLWARWLHMVVGALAVGGLFVALVLDNHVRQGDCEAVATRDWALMIFAVASLAEMLVGLWWLMALPRPVMMRFMGGSPSASALLMLGVAAGTAAVVVAFLKRVRLAVALLVATVLVMALMREVVRFAYLDGVFHPRELAVTPQISPLILFLAVFVVGAGCVIFMLKLAARAGREG